MLTKSNSDPFRSTLSSQVVIGLPSAWVLIFRARCDGVDESARPSVEKDVLQFSGDLCITVGHVLC